MQATIRKEEAGRNLYDVRFYQNGVKRDRDVLIESQRIAVIERAHFKEMLIIDARIRRRHARSDQTDERGVDRQQTWFRGAARERSEAPNRRMSDEQYRNDPYRFAVGGGLRAREGDEFGHGGSTRGKTGTSRSYDGFRPGGLTGRRDGTSPPHDKFEPGGSARGKGLDFSPRRRPTH